MNKSVLMALNVSGLEKMGRVEAEITEGRLTRNRNSLLLDDKLVQKCWSGGRNNYWGTLDDHRNHPGEPTPVHLQETTNDAAEIRRFNINVS